MSSLPQIADTMQEVLTTVANAAAQETGFTRRRSKLTGAAFVQTLVFGWLSHPRGSLAAVALTGAELGVSASPQAFEQRFGEAAAALLQRVLAAAVTAVIAAQPVATGLLARFAGVWVVDSTTVALPDALATAWPGCGGRVAAGTQAALKLTVRLDLRAGRLQGPALSAGRTQDRATALQHAPLAADALRLGDLGFWSLEEFRAIAAQGAWWLSRLNLQVAVCDRRGQRLELARWLGAQGTATIDVPVVLGVAARLPARLLAVRVPPAVAEERRRKLRAAAQREGKTPAKAALALADWTLLVTNVPAERLSVAEALVLARARWQIELLFKLWKSHGAVDESRSAQPWRVLCEVYAKLIAMVVQHWVLLAGCWGFADRSLGQAAAAVRARGVLLAATLHVRAHLVAALATIRRALAAGCKLNRRQTRPSTFQLLTDPSLAGWA